MHTPTENHISTPNGIVLLSSTNSRMRAYDALSTAADRIGRGNYLAQRAEHTKRHRSMRTFKFHVTDAHAAIMTAMPAVLAGHMTAEDAMGLINTYDVLTERLRG